MRWIPLAWIAAVVFSGSTRADDVETIRRVAQDFYVKLHPERATDIQMVSLPRIETIQVVSGEIVKVANPTVRLKDGTVARIQLRTRAGRWVAIRDLGGDFLAEGQPLIVEEIADPQARESVRVERFMAHELERRLRREGKLNSVQSVNSRCFFALQLRKAICSIEYTTWMDPEPECFDEAVLFVHLDGDWKRVVGKFHTGMRLDGSGEVYEMSPRESCLDK
jgi:hypothetical protein